MEKNSVKNRIFCVALALFMTAAILLTGCSSDASVTEITQENSNETLGLAPIFDYELPAEKPSVLTDHVGYLKESRKIVFFQGKELPESFQIIEKESGRCAYRGTIRLKNNNELNGLYIGQGNFTDFRKREIFIFNVIK